MSNNAPHQRGTSFPLDATLNDGGANFSLFAKHSRAAQLLLFDNIDDPVPSRFDSSSAQSPTLGTVEPSPAWLGGCGNHPFDFDH
jgi:pullulanase/glycogen debranching enzyme